MYEYGDIIDIFVEVIISILLFLFFKALALFICIEASSIANASSAQTESNPNENSQDINLLVQEIKITPRNQLNTEKNKLNSIALVLLTVKKFKHLRCCSKIISDHIISNKEQAIKFYYKISRILLLFVIVIPLIFLVKAIIDHNGFEGRAPTVILNIVKRIITGYCMYNLVYFVKNLEEILKDYALLTKFFCVKLIIFFFIVQTIILNFAHPSTDYHGEEEMSQIINFVLLNIENCFIGFMWVATYGYQKIGIEKYKFPEQNNNSELIPLPNNGEVNKKENIKSN